MINNRNLASLHSIFHLKNFILLPAYTQQHPRLDGISLIKRGQRSRAVLQKSYL